jgi:hypothetical protein
MTGNASKAGLSHRSPIVDDSLLVPMGIYPGITSINKFGRNGDVDGGETQEIWDGALAYTYPTDTTAMTHIRSAVDSATTRGAVIEVQGLDANWDLVVQTKALDGTNSTTEVALDTALIRCFRMKVLDGSVMDQDIWLGDDDFVVTAAKAIITAGNNQTLMAMYTVPAGHTAYLTNYYAHSNPLSGSNVTSNSIRLWATDNVNGYARQLKHDVGLPDDGHFIHNFSPYYRFAEKTDIVMTSSPVAVQAVDVSAGFDLIVVDNSIYG